MPDSSRPATADYGQALKVGERVRLMRDGLINYSSVLVSGVVGILLVPFMLRNLGPEPYGLWIAALSLAGMVSVFDFGLNWSLTRQVAACRTGENREATARFVVAAGKVYLLIGTAGALLIGVLGLPISGRLHLSPETSRSRPPFSPWWDSASLPTRRWNS